MRQRLGTLLFLFEILWEGKQKQFLTMKGQPLSIVVSSGRSRDFTWWPHYVADPDIQLGRVSLICFSVCHVNFFVGGGPKSIAKLGDQGRIFSPGFATGWEGAGANS